MAGLLTSAYDLFWSERFWLQSNYSWAKIEEIKSAGQPYAAPYEMSWSLVVAMLFLVLRYPFNWYICEPITNAYKLKGQKMAPAPPHPSLESAYRRGKLAQSELMAMSKQIDVPVRDIQRWMRKRAAQDKISPKGKVHETIFYTALYLHGLIHGLIVIWDKPWIQDTRYLWYGYPSAVSLDIKIYIIVQTAKDIAVVIWILIDVQRKDFWQSVAHHFFTVALLFISWGSAGLPIAALTLVIHEPGPLIVQFGKTLKYLGFSAMLCNMLFLLFAVTWFYTRLYYYPATVIYSAIFESYDIVGFVPAFVVCHTFLCALLVMHVIWAYMIVKTAYSLIFKGKAVEKDARSETDVSDSGDEKAHGHTPKNTSVSSS